MEWKRKLQIDRLIPSQSFVPFVECRQPFAGKIDGEAAEPFDLDRLVRRGKKGVGRCGPIGDRLVECRPEIGVLLVGRESLDVITQVEKVMPSRTLEKLQRL